MKLHVYLMLLAGAVGAGCISESSTPAAVCRWPGDATGWLDLSTDGAARQLSEDAERAEDLAIRYADGHSRPGTVPGASMADYQKVRDQCMASLFQLIADQHHVTPQQVRGSINTHRRTSLDVAVMLSFGLLYAAFANRLVRGVWRRFPPTEDRWAGFAATILLSLAASLTGVVVGEMWSGQAEALRIGYGHVSYRANRIPWGQHRSAVSVVGVSVFWILSWLRYREGRT
jgi:hypothetical protein